MWSCVTCVPLGRESWPDDSTKSQTGRRWWSSITQQCSYMKEVVVWAIPLDCIWINASSANIFPRNAVRFPTVVEQDSQFTPHTTNEMTRCGHLVGLRMRDVQYGKVLTLIVTVKPGWRDVRYTPLIVERLTAYCKLTLRYHQVNYNIVVVKH